MEMHRSDEERQALTLVLQRREIPIFRALLDRANFVDIRPEMLERVLDMVERLQVELTEPDR